MMVVVVMIGIECAGDHLMDTCQPYITAICIWFRQRSMRVYALRDDIHVLFKFLLFILHLLSMLSD